MHPAESPEQKRASRHRTRSGEFAIASVPSVLWTYLSPTPLTRLIAGPDIVIASSARQTIALDAETGAFRWSLPGADSAASGTTIHDGRVLRTSTYGVHAHDAGDGKEIWRSRVLNARGAPLVVGDECIVANTQGLHGRTMHKGHKKWTCLAETHVRTTIAHRDGIAYLQGIDRMLAIDVARKCVIWQTPTVGSFEHGPILTGNALIFLENACLLTAVHCETGRPIWQTRVAAHGRRPVVVAGECVVLRDDHGRLRAYDLDDGTRRWSSKGGRRSPSGIGEGGPIIVDDNVLSVTVEDTRTHLTAIRSHDGAVRWNVHENSIGHRLSWNGTPQSANGTLYTSLASGIVALR